MLCFVVGTCENAVPELCWVTNLAPSVASSWFLPLAHHIGVNRECVRLRGTSFSRSEPQSAHAGLQRPRFDLLVPGSPWKNELAVSWRPESWLDKKQWTDWRHVWSDLLWGSRFATTTAMGIFQVGDWDCFPQDLFLGNTFSHLAGGVLFGPKRCTQNVMSSSSLESSLPCEQMLPLFYVLVGP